MRSLRLCLSIAALAASGAVLAGEPAPECRAAFKGRRVSLVVPNAPGGGFDNYARAFAPVFERLSGARVTVTNLPAAGGLMAFKAVAESTDDSVRFGLADGGNLVTMSETTHEISLKQFVFLGVVNTERQAWLTRADYQLKPGAKAPLVASASSAAAVTIEVGMAGEALGLPVKTAAGYKGTSDRVAAVLRGEADVTTASASSIKKSLQAGGVKALFVLSDASDDVLPGVPHFAGKGGVVEQHYAKASPAERARAMQLAQAVVDIALSWRPVITGSQLSANTQKCLASFVEGALFSEEFARAANQVGRAVAPLGRAATQAMADKMVAVTQTHQALLGRLVAEAAR